MPSFFSHACLNLYNFTLLHSSFLHLPPPVSLTLCVEEEQNRGKPNWEHLNEDLHVLITVEDAQNRAEIKLKRAVEEVKRLLVPAAEGEDNLKKMQLMELAILNGTYRDANIKPSSLAFCLAASSQSPRMHSGPAPVFAPPTGLRTPAPTGPALVPLIRQIQTVLPSGTPHPAALMPGSGPESSFIYATPYDYQYALAAPGSILEYPLDSGGVSGKLPHPCSCDCSPMPHHHPHGQWSPAPTLLLRHAS
ncbi:protein quaking-B-like [Xyrichtys novacula]|uniref:Protein quaking-B-like n=1 Tax=Xyrichtys novacula TaxID=13765 RepID=A0AAV1G2F5_XYRNO|nr:protein quaking-B-like [Xyrichtys novacula]